MQPDTSAGSRLRQFGGRFSASSPVSFIRSRRGLAAAGGVCLLILGLVVLFQPADEGDFAVDDFDFGEFDQATIGEEPGAAPSSQSSDTQLTGSEGPFDPSGVDSAPRAVTLIPTGVPQPDHGVRQLATDAASPAQKPVAWLTGTIEE